MTLMMVEVRTAKGALLKLPLDDISDGFVVQNITGLDPVKATLVSSGYANEDGEQYHSSKRDKRNIVLSLGLEPDYGSGSVRQLRNELYNFFMPKAEVFLRFISDEEEPVEIGGRVESFEAPLFTQQPQATISVINFDPDFVALKGSQFSGTTVQDLTETAFHYDGTVETGFVCSVAIKQNITQLSIFNRPPDGQLRRMDFNGTFLAGDRIEISTVVGSKSVTLYRIGSPTSILYTLAPYSDWIQLFPGDNYFRVTNANTPMNYTIDYINKYGGL